MTTLTAKSILSSMHAVTGDRLDTLLLRYPRCIHSEFMTHRVFSRNAASSRAIPVAKLIADVEADSFAPLVWTKNEPGMQGREELTGPALAHALAVWFRAKNTAIAEARKIAESGAHKQIVNRLLEPFAHITVVVSSTTWLNFLALRDHPDAEPHIQILAREVRKALDGAAVNILEPGQWHLPFVSEEETRTYQPLGLRVLSTARCASTSYKTVDGFDMDMPRAIDIFNKLANADPIHASPFEHVAQADEWGGEFMVYKNIRQHRNFTGFRQLRATIEEERA
jgi:thymidylate synthase ThyX